MRYLILLVFVIPLASQSATVRGQTCTVTDLENADPGCCASTMYMCSDLTVSGQSDSDKKSCCNANTQCKWVTNKAGVPSNVQNTCQPKNNINCTAQTINKCTITTGTYTHNTIASSKDTPKTANCTSGSSGDCSYKCYGGVWHTYTSGIYTGNQCRTQCNGTTIDHCTLQVATSGTQGACETGYTSSCRYVCSNSNWIKVYNHCRKDRHFCRNISPSTAHCGSGFLSFRGIGETITRDCTTGYQGECTFRCNSNKRFSVLSHNCGQQRKCPAQTFRFTYRSFTYRCPLPSVLPNGLAFCNYGPQNVEREIKGFYCSSSYEWRELELYDYESSQHVCFPNCYVWRMPGQPGYIHGGSVSLVRKPSRTLPASSLPRHSKVEASSGAWRETKRHYQ